MNNDPLTHRFKHEAREIDPDPLDWLEGPPERRPPVMTSVLLVLAIVALFAISFYWVPTR